MKRTVRSLRLSQSITPFGVGAIYDVLGESFVACDIAHWKGRGEPLELARLAESLGVTNFRGAPSRASLFQKSPGGIPYYRFPQWLFCSKCRRMSRWSLAHEEKDKAPRCTMCAGAPRLVPMRFVMVCRKGHLGDIPWDRWAHSRARTPDQKQCADRQLRFETRTDVGGGLGSLVVKCANRKCGAERSLEGIASSGSMKSIGVRCTGRQPWQRQDESTGCDEDAQVVQRGASNVYFASIASAIDIPPESDWDPDAELVLAVTNHDMYPVLRSSTTGPVAELAAGAIAGDCKTTPEKVIEIARLEAAERSGEPLAGPKAVDIEGGEWLAFLSERSDQDDRDRFVTRHVGLAPVSGAATTPTVDAQLNPLVDRVVLATRLREVRALAGFSRLEPAGATAALVKPDLGRALPWLPAVEVYGEGIFVSFNETSLAAWEGHPEVSAQARDVESRRAAGTPWLPTATPRFIFLHTLAHLLIRQLAFECGYSSASLAERVYCATPEEGEPRAGVLIYTAAGDAEGSLGGLVRQGEPPRFARTLLAALQAGAWCSSDPICREVVSGLRSLNRAACHACALVSETSCSYSNSLLDRRFVIGAPEVPGYLSPVLDAALEASTSEQAG